MDKESGKMNKKPVLVIMAALAEAAGKIVGGLEPQPPGDLGEVQRPLPDHPPGGLDLQTGEVLHDNAPRRRGTPCSR